MRQNGHFDKKWVIIHITSYQHNQFKLSRDKTLISTIAYCIYYIMSSFEEYTDLLVIHSVNLSSIFCEIKEIHDYIANNPNLFQIILSKY